MAAIFIDLKKAFDAVNHEILLRKMEIYGIRGNSHSWFKNYLENRKQYIECQSVKTESVNIEVGVPQGSNLGPLLFLLHINDISHSLKHGRSTLFPDDTTIYNNGQNKLELCKKMNEDLASLNNWISANKLTLNTNKTYACIFGNINRNENEEYKFYIIDKQIQITNFVRYLGVEVDSQLSWSAQIAKLTNKCNQVVGVLSKIRPLINKTTAKQIYYALVHSRLIYCQEIWGTACKTTLLPLERMQKKVIRIICQLDKREHSIQLFQQLNIKPLNKEINYRRTLPSYNVVKNPISYNIYLDNVHNHTYETRFSSNNLPVPRSRTWRWGTRSIRYLLIQAYNNLPDEVQKLPPATVSVYKRRIIPYFMP